MKDFLGFEKMYSTMIIKLVYWLGIFSIILATLSGIVAALSGYSASILGAFGAILSGLFGLLFWRLVCELWVVIFGIHDRLGQLRDLTSASSNAAPAASSDTP